MAKKRRSSKKQNNKKLIKIAVLIIAGLIVVIFGGTDIGDLIGIDLYKKSDIILETNITDPSAFSAYFIDIGQGDSILLAKDGHYALVDAGESLEPSEHESLKAIKSRLNTLGVKKLDFLLVTHQDYDHIGSAEQILKDYDVEVFYDNGVEHTSATYEKLMQYVLDNDINYTQIREGDIIKSPWENVTIDVLSPPQDLIYTGKSPDINENSIILKITYGKVSYLLTGDAGRKAEKYILSEYYSSEINSDILKAGHHGSRESSTSDFLNAVSPDIIVISAGNGNDYGHPHTAALKRFVKYTDKIYRTDLDGDILAATDGTRIAVSSCRKHDYSKILISGEGEKVSA